MYTKPTNEWYKPVNNTAVLRFDLTTTTTKTSIDNSDLIENSAFFRYSTISSVIQIPSFSGFSSKNTLFNIYGIDPYNIFINSMIYNLKSTNFGLGLCLGQEEYSLGDYTVVANTTNPNLAQISYVTTGTTGNQFASTAIRIHNLDKYDKPISGIIPFLKRTDQIFISNPYSSKSSKFSETKL